MKVTLTTEIQDDLWIDAPSSVKPADGDYCLILHLYGSHSITLARYIDKPIRDSARLSQGFFFAVGDYLAECFGDAYLLTTQNPDIEDHLIQWSSVDMWRPIELPKRSINGKGYGYFIDDRIRDMRMSEEDDRKYPWEDTEAWNKAQGIEE